jgi:hypothetical protein
LAPGGRLSGITEREAPCVESGLPPERILALRWKDGVADLSGQGTGSQFTVGWRLEKLSDNELGACSIQGGACVVLSTIFA